MKLIMLAFPVLAAVLLAGCNDPAPVELLPPPDTSGFEIVAIAAVDTSTDSPQVDSTAVLPADRVRFAGYFGVTKIVLDNGDTLRTAAVSRVLLENRSRPIRLLGHLWGFHGVNVGTLTLNGTPMIRIPHRIRIRRQLLDTVVTAGVEYLQDIGATHGPGLPYTWLASAPDSLAPFEFTTTTPENITVQSPAGGSIVSRFRDLPLRWAGQGNLSIVISGYLPGTRRTIPLLRLRPRVNTGSLIIPRKIMSLLPADRFRYFAFSFILENRSESNTIGGYDGPILIQAASVYTSFVEVR